MQESAIAKALAEAQAEFPEITRNKKVSVRTKSGGTYTFSYATFDEIILKVRPCLNKHGIALTQTLSESNGKVVVKTILRHSEGGVLESGGTPVNPVEEGPQAFGSALTYSKRYDASTLLGLATEDDDDGNVGSGNEAEDGSKKDDTSKKKDQRPNPSFKSKLDAAAAKGIKAYKEAWKSGSKEERDSCKVAHEMYKEIAIRNSTDEELKAEGIDR